MDCLASGGRRLRPRVRQPLILHWKERERERSTNIDGRTDADADAPSSSLVAPPPLPPPSPTASSDIPLLPPCYSICISHMVSQSASPSVSQSHIKHARHLAAQCSFVPVLMRLCASTSLGCKATASGSREDHRYDKVEGTKESEGSLKPSSQYGRPTPFPTSIAIPIRRRLSSAVQRPGLRRRYGGRERGAEGLFDLEK